MIDSTLAPLVLLDNYDSFTYNLFQMVQAQTNRPVLVYRNDALTFEALQALKPERVILSPGPGHPGNDADFGLCRDVLLRWDELQCPILGVCLGHQGMVQHLGGQVIQAPTIVHGKMSAVIITEPSPLFEGLPSPFQAMRYHSLVAAETVANENVWPGDLRVIAREQKDGLVMALQHKSRPWYGVQFHPESIGTPEGALLLRNFVERC
jgi:anthranilate synthase/aminodeoxychorismate synthase-like glutamine amidotransferase